MRSIIQKAKGSSVRVIMSTRSRNIGSGRGSVIGDPLGDPEIPEKKTEKVIIDNYLKFNSQDNSKISFNLVGEPNVDLDYSFDEINWNKSDFSEIDLAPGDSIYFRGNNPKGFNKDNDNTFRFVITGNVSVSGDISRLLSYRNNVSKLPIDFCFAYLFADCTGITDASDLILPFKRLTRSCYYRMFSGCKNLKKAPELPAVDLGRSCYSTMFNECTSLKLTPELPALNLSEYCYHQMFLRCTSLIEVSTLKAEYLKEGCYRNMFYGCTSLAIAPELNSIHLSESCYNAMFYECSNLVNFQEILPSMDLAPECYQWMFYGCTKLSKAPRLPALKLKDRCYRAMFSRCTSLVDAPELPATELANRCYEYMFYRCSRLVNVPSILPALTLPEGIYLGPMQPYEEWGNIEGCYYYMFSDCQNLVNSPVLPAKQLSVSCYSYMFATCPKLEKIYVLATNIFTDSLSTDFANKNNATIDFLHQQGVITKVYVPPGMRGQWTQLNQYYTHLGGSGYPNVIELTQEEYEEILERYHIIYND